MLPRPTNHHSLPPLELVNVWKQYHLGSQHDSLRDVIPALVRRMLGRSTNGHAGSDDQAGKFWALRDVSFDVKRTETLGVIGPNGAGKSTVLKLLSKICRQTKGQIHVRGRLAALIEVGAGFHPDLTGRENIYLNGTIMGLRRKEIRRCFDSIVEFSELDRFLDMPVKRYSSGMSVRLGFAVAAHVRPEILLIDEVLAVGDLAFQQKCYQRILDLKAAGTTIIFVSHNLEAVQRLCDRVIVLHRGEVLVSAAPAEAMARYRQATIQKTQRFQKVWTPLGEWVADTSKDIQLVGAQLVRSDNKAAETIETGETVRIQVNYVAHRPIRNPAVTVTLERIDGLICHEAVTRVSGLTWDAWQGRGSITLEYPQLNLLPHTYIVHAVCHEDQNPVPVARLNEPLYFHITSTQPTRGAVHLPHTWLVEAR